MDIETMDVNGYQIPVLISLTHPIGDNIETVTFLLDNKLFFFATFIFKNFIFSKMY
jgi:hypothetical protein